jgi:hypothetical protein
MWKCVNPKCGYGFSEPLTKEGYRGGWSEAVDCCPKCYSDKIEELPPTENLTFFQAVEAMADGKRVRRKNWRPGGSLGVLEPSYKQLQWRVNGELQFSLVVLSLDDYQAEDWQIVEEP